MLWVGTLFVVSAATAIAPPARAELLASTYDQAACDDATAPAAPDLDGGKCTEPTAPAPTPAVIDCNDPGFSQWVGDMIGSCDMPRPTAGPTAPAAATPGKGHDGDNGRSCGLFCGRDEIPIQPAGRSLDEGQPVLHVRHLFQHRLTAAPLVQADEPAPDEPDRPRLERPPRA